MSANPYRLGPTDNERLLRTRAVEIRRAVEALTDREADATHALILGDPRSGRTSAMDAVARRVREADNALAVRLRLADDDLTTSGLTRALLNAAIEAVVADSDTMPDWYVAWCDR